MGRLRRRPGRQHLHRWRHFERGWDHDNDESTPDQPITAAAQLRKWAGYAAVRAGSIYTGVDITAENAGAAWNSNLDTIQGALATLSDENATPEELQAAAATLNGLADAFDGSGFERTWDHDSDESTPDQPITAAAQLRRWAGYAAGRAGSIYTDGDITAENAPAAWNNNLDAVNGALDVLRDPDATPEELQQAAATLNGLADAFDGSGFERGWDHDNDEATPDQPITAAEQLRKWAGYAKGRAASIYTDGGDITAENAASAWNSNLDTIKGALATLNDPDATPEELREASKTLNGLAVAFTGSGFERPFDDDNDQGSPDRMLSAAEVLGRWATYARERAGPLPPQPDLSTVTTPAGGGRTVEFRVGIDGLPFGLWDPGTVVTPEMAAEMGRPDLAGMVLTHRSDAGAGGVTTVRFEDVSEPDAGGAGTPTSAVPGAGAGPGLGQVAIPNADGTVTHVPADSPLAFLVSPEGAQWVEANPDARVVPPE